MKAEIKGKDLVITIPLNAKPEASSTGKTLLIASTHGAMKSSLKVSGEEVSINLNAYIRNGKAAH